MWFSIASLQKYVRYDEHRWVVWKRKSERRSCQKGLYRIGLFLTLSTSYSPPSPCTCTAYYRYTHVGLACTWAGDTNAPARHRAGPTRNVAALLHGSHVPYTVRMHSHAYCPYIHARVIARAQRSIYRQSRAGQTKGSCQSFRLDCT